MMHEEFAPLYANGTYSGVFLGDEICCAGVPLADLQQVLTMLRSLVGPDAILYTNECGEMASWPKGIHYCTAFPPLLCAKAV